MLRDLRENAHLTQQELADKVGITRSQICMIEIGKSKPSIELAKKLGEALDTDWTIFF